MRVSVSEQPLDVDLILTWVSRLLYLEIFISLMVVMGYWHIPLTFAFLGAVGSLVYAGFVWKNKEEEEPEIIPNKPSLNTGILMTKKSDTHS